MQSTKVGSGASPQENPLFERYCAYNGDGILVQAGDTYYTQDLAAPLAQVLHDGSAAYVYGHERLAAIEQDGTRTWYLGDALGSIRMRLDDAGVPRDAAAYTPFGIPHEAMPAPFGFTGELHDAGLVYLRARWYNPGSGTFVTRDPFAGYAERPYSLHPYQYAYSNPLVWTDASGKCVPYVEEGCVPVWQLGQGLNLEDGATYLWDVFQGAGSPGAFIVEKGITPYLEGTPLGQEFGKLGRRLGVPEGYGFDCIWAKLTPGKVLGAALSVTAAGVTIKRVLGLTGEEESARQAIEERRRAIPGGQVQELCQYTATGYLIGCNPKEFSSGPRSVEAELDQLPKDGNWHYNERGQMFNPFSERGSSAGPHFAVKNIDGTITDPSILHNLNAQATAHGQTLPPFVQEFRYVDTFTQTEYDQLLDLWEYYHNLP